jgi:EAL and modified HD-GYP domain-containing signal transduction protein
VADFCVARQPIFDGRTEVVAYELLFRRASTLADADVIDADGATASVLLNAFAELGIDAVVGARQAYINVPWQLLVADPPLPGPPERIVVELLEGAPATPEVVEAIRRVQARGYRVALDDFVYEPALEPLLEVADLVKVDLLQIAPEDLEAQLRALSRFDVELLAEKVETHEQLERCRELGFDLFQGFVLSRPRTLTGRTLPLGATGRLALLATLQDPDASPEDIAACVGRDVGLSYKLLRYVNSAFFSLPRTVSSVREALVLLGTRAVRRWASLLILSSIEDQPHELLVTALVRARTCELLASASGAQDDKEAYFTTGLFSVADALMGTDLEQVLDALPLDEGIRHALLEHGGAKGAALAAIKAYERGRIEEIPPHLREPIGPAYLDAVRSADELAVALA